MITKELRKEVLDFIELNCHYKNKSIFERADIPVREAYYNTLELVKLLSKLSLESLRSQDGFAIEVTPNMTVSLFFSKGDAANNIVGTDIGESAFSYFVKTTDQPTKYMNNRSINIKEVNILSKYVRSL